jgi:DedD protein
MGLFSFLSKNKQASTAEDSGYYSGADEQALNARARSKRASNADEPAAARRGGKGAADDPVLPEKKRARRRLVGAIGLALAVAIGLPMILDSEPKPLASDIEIRIPSKAQAVTNNGAASGNPSAGVNGTAQGTIQAAVPAPGAALDASEQIITSAPPLPAIVMPATDVKPAPAPMPLPAPKVEAPVRQAESRPEPRPEPKPVAKAEPVPESKPAPKAVDSTRALAILEGRPVIKEAAVKEPAAKEAGKNNYVVQVAALATQDKVDELQERLKAAGIDSYTQKISTSAGQRIRIRVGPFGSREEADKALAKLARLGLNGSLVSS